MSDMKFTLPGSETVTLTGQTIDKLIRAGDGDAALLYLYILKTRAQSSSSEAAAALGKTTGGIATAMAVLSRLGLVQLDEINEHDSKAPPLTGTDLLPEDQPRQPTVSEMKRELESGSVFSTLIEEAQRSLGKILSPDDMLRLFGIYDSLQMEPEVILQLITHCISETRGKSGGRMPSVRYIEKTAYTWAREGIFTLDKAEEYLKALDVRRNVRYEIKSAMQIFDREFSDAEKRYVDNWSAMGFSPSAVAIAYDRTMLKTGKLAWGYMNSIINSWHNRGLHTTHEIMEKDGSTERESARKNVKQPIEQKFGSADKEDIARMQRLLNKIKEE